METFPDVVNRANCHMPVLVKWLQRLPHLYILGGIHTGIRTMGIRDVSDWAVLSFVSTGTAALWKGAYCSPGLSSDT